MKSHFNRFAIVLAVAAALSAASCSKKPKPDEGITATDGPSADANTLGDSDSGKANGLQTVHFGYDSSTLNEEGKAILNANAGILKNNGNLKIQVEGHCDSRGGIQYNIALGEKRATMVKSFLADKGIAEDRIATISYGKERPVLQGETEEAYSKNRRANFVITSK